MKETGGRGAFRVEQGDEAPLPGVEDLSLRTDRAANGRGAELLGFTQSATPLAGLAAGDVLVVADEELAGADAADVAKASAIVVIGDDAAPVGAASRRGRAADRQLHGRGRDVHQPARPRAALHAGEGRARLRSAELVRDRRPARRPRNAGRTTRSPATCSSALAGAQSEFAGMSYDTLGLRGRMIAGAQTAGARA